MKVKGTYILVVEEPREEEIKVGALGSLHFRKGFYVYVGSALGSGGIIARIDRHIAPGKKSHWHIDYFMKSAHPVGEMHFPGKKMEECSIAHKIESLAEEKAPKFGSSDCKCASHLFYFKKNPMKNNKIIKTLTV